MSQQRYTPEFKDEAVRQVTEKGHSVQEVAEKEVEERIKIHREGSRTE